MHSRKILVTCFTFAAGYGGDGTPQHFVVKKACNNNSELLDLIVRLLRLPSVSLQPYLAAPRFSTRLDGLGHDVFSWLARFRLHACTKSRFLYVLRPVGTYLDFCWAETEKPELDKN
jgi:hypothetical protein